MQLNPADAARVQVCPWHRGLKYNKISKDAYTDLVAGLTPEGEMPADINILDTFVLPDAGARRGVYAIVAMDVVDQVQAHLQDRGVNGVAQDLFDDFMTAKIRNGYVIPISSKAGGVKRKLYRDRHGVARWTRVTDSFRARINMFLARTNLHPRVREEVERHSATLTRLVNSGLLGQLARVFEALEDLLLEAEEAADAASPASHYEGVEQKHAAEKQELREQAAAVEEQAAAEHNLALLQSRRAALQAQAEEEEAAYNERKERRDKEMAALEQQLAAASLAVEE